MTDHLEAESHKGDVGLDRLLFFSDGVFAIAITLLSIELHPPERWDGSLAMLVSERWPMLAAFTISFLVIGIFWNSHRRLFMGMTRFTQGVFWLNLLLLGAIALMPFATSLTYQLGAGSEKFAIYLGLVSAAGLLQGLIYGYAAFVADVIRPRKPWIQRLSAFLAMALMPGACCGLSLMAAGGAPLTILLLLAALIVFLVAFSVFAGRQGRVASSPA